MVASFLTKFNQMRVHETLKNDCYFLKMRTCKPERHRDAIQPIRRSFVSKDGRRKEIQIGCYSQPQYQFLYLRLLELCIGSKASLSSSISSLATLAALVLRLVLDAGLDASAARDRELV